jgi:hypothetical protein
MDRTHFDVWPVEKSRAARENRDVPFSPSKGEEGEEKARGRLAAGAPLLVRRQDDATVREKSDREPGESAARFRELNPAPAIRLGGFNQPFD